jgi:hypothetical protein
MNSLLWRACRSSSASRGSSRFLAFLFPLLVPLSGCTFGAGATTTTPKPPPTSSTIATSAMWPSMSAQSDGASLKVYAAVLESSDFIKLDAGDFFSAKVGDRDVVMTVEPYTDGKVHYLATFASPTVATDVVIALHRGAGHTEALESKTSIAGAFEVTSAPPTSLKHGTLLALTVSPPPLPETAADKMTVQFFGDCLEGDQPSFALTFDVEGRASFDTAAVQLKKDATSGCDVGVQVRHETRGPADPAFANASIHPVEGLQTRGFTTALIR